MSKTLQEKLKKNLRKRLVPVILCFVFAIIFVILAAVFYPGKEKLKEYLREDALQAACAEKTEVSRSIIKRMRLTGTVSISIREEAGDGDGADDVLPGDFCGTASITDTLEKMQAKLFIWCAVLAVVFFLAGIILFFTLKIPARSAELKAAKAAAAEPRVTKTQKTAARSKWPKEASPRPGKQQTSPETPSGPSAIDSVTAQLGGTTESITQPFSNTMELNPQELFIIEEDIGYLGSDELIG